MFLCFVVAATLMKMMRLSLLQPKRSHSLDHALLYSQPTQQIWPLTFNAITPVSQLPCLRTSIEQAKTPNTHFHVLFTSLGMKGPKRKVFLCRLKGWGAFEEQRLFLYQREVGTLRWRSGFAAEAGCILMSHLHILICFSVTYSQSYTALIKWRQFQLCF